MSKTKWTKEDLIYNINQAMKQKDDEAMQQWNDLLDMLVAFNEDFPGETYVAYKCSNCGVHFIETIDAFTDLPIVCINCELAMTEDEDDEYDYEDRFADTDYEDRDNSRYYADDAFLDDMDISGNMACDSTGICGGMDCPKYFNCQGGC